MVYTIGIGGMFPSFEQVSMEEVIAYCKDKKVLGVDTETEGLDFLSKRMLMCQIGDRHNQYIIDVRTTDISGLKPILEDKSIVKILHNVKFDDKFFRKLHIQMNNVWDTMLVEQVLTCGLKERYGLINVIGKYLPDIVEQIDKSTRNQFIDLGGKPFTEKQIAYGANDILVLQDIMEKQQEEVLKQDLGRVVELENTAAIAFSDIEFNGIGIDPKPWLALGNRSKEEMLEVGLELDDLVTNNSTLSKFVATEVQGDLFMPIEEIRKINIKWTSPTQVLKVLQTYGLAIEKVGYFDLMKYKRDPLVSKYLFYKKKQKLCTSYGEDFLKYIRSDGRIHTGFRQILDTGRVASSNPNMQQIPADNSYRNCFIPGISGWVFVSADYSSQELCLIAEASKDPVWLDALKKGEDLHSICAALVFGDEWKDSADTDCAYMISKSKCSCSEHKKLRNSIKTISFGLCYGMSAFKLSDSLQIPVEEAENLIKLYFNAFPKIKGLLDNLSKFGREKGFIMTFSPYRRKRYFPEWERRMTFKVKGSIERMSRNTPIQGAGADMVKKALVLIYEEIYTNSLPVKLIMTVHDQIDTIVESSYAETWKIRLQELMKEAADITVVSGLLESEADITPVWSK